MLRYCFTVIGIAVCFTTYAQNQKKAFTWGINGHPLTQRAYTKNLDDQLSRIADLKLDSYRIDVLLDSNGYSKKEALFNEVLVKLKKNNVSTLLVVMLSGLKNKDNEQIYQTTYNQGKNFGKRYGQYLSVIEINNEADNKVMFKGDHSGMKASHYDPEKTQRITAGMRGFINGLKEVKPSVKVTLSVSYTHLYYLQLLKDNNVNYDIIGCHWYSNMGDITNVNPSVGNVLERMSKTYNKPIWVTEFNHGKGTTKASFEKQNEYITTTIPKIIASGLVSGLFIYELYDQPAIRRQYPNEACYGLMLKDSLGNIVPKDAYTGYKQIIQQYKNK